MYGAAGGMGGGADEAAGFRGDDHGWCPDSAGSGRERREVIIKRASANGCLILKKGIKKPRTSGLFVQFDPDLVKIASSIFSNADSYTLASRIGTSLSLF